MLWRSELKKLLLTQKGILLLTVCLLLKLVFLCAFPELKDSRIVLSQKQYDKYLSQLYGENTPEKSQWILEEYENCKRVKDSQQEMREKYARGELSEEAWNDFLQELELAELHINSAKIFAEKAEQFALQPENIAPAHYIYEYGWQTVYTLLRFPDIFLLFGMLLLSAQCFSSEAASGMLPVLLAAKNGRRKLYFAKLLALAAVGCMAFALFAGVEVAVFSLRGWCKDSAAPLHSVTCMTASTLPLTLGQGYGLCLLARGCATLLFAASVYALSVWLKDTANLIFLGLCVLGLPVLWGGTAALFTHGGLLCGSQMLLWLSEGGFSLLLPLAVVAGYSIIILIFAAQRHQKGL